MDVKLRTVSMSGERVDETLLEAISHEEPDQVVLGWRGTLSDGGDVFGSNLDAVVEDAPCEVTLVTFHEKPIGRTVALAGSGPHAPFAARRAAEFATVDGAMPTLLNVQQTQGEEAAAVERGGVVIDEVARRAGLEPGAYQREVIVTDDIETTIIETVGEYETICVGLSEQSAAARLMFGTIATRISQEATSNVGIVRGTKESA
jgi:nucleotide-binding universal stress UspA family protein